MKDAIKIVKKMLKHEEEILDKMEIQSAPSGEWAEYNIEFLKQDTVVLTLYEVIEELERREDESSTSI